MNDTRFDHFIDGHRATPASGEYFDVVDPSTGRTFAAAARGGADDVDRAVESARGAQAAWRATGPRERGRTLHRVAARILAEADGLARIESVDTGFPLRDCRMIVREVAARHFEYYAGLADKLCGETVPVPGNHLDYTLREPLGVVAAIIPWNSPLYEGCRCVAPALAVGNAVVLKPAEEALASMLRVAEIAVEEGLPRGVFNVVTGFGDEAGAALAAHPGIDAISFTGSQEAGAEVMRRAAANAVPVGLELGGKSANIIFADADLDAALFWTMYGIFTASGQVCVAGSRLLLGERIHDEFVDRLVSAAGQLRVGPGLEDPDLGPLISERQLERVLGYIATGEAEGASIVAGGGRLVEGGLAGGYFVAPTIFDRAENGMQICQEEIFGPVLSVLTFSDADEAVALANGTPYGLAAAVWTRDLRTAHRMASRLEAGSVYVNRYYPAGLEAPAGAFKRSGFGSVDGPDMARNFTRVKNVVINLD